MKRSLSNVVAFSVIFLLAQCRPETSESANSKDATKLEKSATKDDRLRFAIIVDTLVPPMRNAQTELLDRLIRSRPGMKVDKYNADGNASLQAEQIKEAVKNGVDFLLVFPQDVSKIAPELRAAIQQGAKVFVFSKQGTPDASTCRIFVDERKLGQVAGEFVVAALSQKAKDENQPEVKGRVVELRNDEGLNSAERALGFSEALAKVPGIVLVHDAPADSNEKAAGERIQEAVRLQKQFDIVYAHNDLIALGASKFLKTNHAEDREKMLILGTDGFPGKNGGQAMVLQAEIEATIYQPPLVDFAWNLIQQIIADPTFSPKKQYEIKPFLITSDSVNELVRRGLPTPVIE